MSEAHPPQLQLIQMSTAYWASRYLHLAAQLKLADCFADGPKTADEVAPSTSTHAPSLYRFLRALASLGLFTEDAERRFSLTPMGDLLRTGTQHSLHTSVLVLAGGWFAHALDNLLYSLQSGKTAFEKTFEMPLFDWLAKHPGEASQFSETMVGIHGAEPGAVAAYDFSAFETIVDVGGATGNLLTAILARHPRPRGILFDRPHVVRDAPAFIRARGLDHRIAIDSGNFFESVPSGGDAYLLSHIIHDWGEAQCLTILGNIRRAMKPSSRLLIIEMVLPSGDVPHPGKMPDIIMLAVPGGPERAEPEYRTLLEKAGFRLERVFPTASAVSVVEAFPA